MRRRRGSALRRRYGRQRRGWEPTDIRERMKAQDMPTQRVRAIPMQEMLERDRREREQQERGRR
jgi:hypothetical protein